MPPPLAPLDAALADLLREEVGRPVSELVARVAAVAERMVRGPRGPAASPGDALAHAVAAPVEPAGHTVRRVARVRRPARPPADLEVAPVFAEVPSPVPSARVWVRREGALLPVASVAPSEPAPGEVGSE